MLKVKMSTTDRQSGFPNTPALRALIKCAVRTTLSLEGLEGLFEVEVTLTDNEGIREYNKNYRGIDKETDVLSFPLYDPASSFRYAEDQYVPLGDIVLSLEQAKKQSDTFGHSFERETAYLVAHSTLHLLGMDHERSDAEDALMREKQNAVMASLGLEVG